MVGFVKELIEEQGHASIAAGCKTGERISKFKKLLVTPGIVFVFKAVANREARQTSERSGPLLTSL